MPVGGNGKGKSTEALKSILEPLPVCGSVKFRFSCKLNSVRTDSTGMKDRPTNSLGFGLSGMPKKRNDIDDP